MGEANVLNPYSPLTETRYLFNNPKRSDVRFFVDGQTIYGHKLILSMGSPVFDSMFFGQLREQRDVFEIEDLSLVGFTNALRYIYGFPIDFELIDLYESYMAADKYLIHHFDEALFEYVNRRLNPESSCLIYDQLMKIGDREEISLAHVRTMIVENSKAALESEHFTQIGQETLIGLLSLDKLAVHEDDLVAAVSKWVDYEVQRQDLPANFENRRKVFDPIKSYILFTSLTPEQISDCEEITNLLTLEERKLLVLHVVNNENPWTIQLKSSRKVGANACSVFISDFVNLAGPPYSRGVGLSVSRRARILTIYLTYSEKAPGVSLRILDSNGVDLGLETRRLAKDGKVCFSFYPYFVVQPNCSYKLEVIGDGKTSATIKDQLSQQKTLDSKGLKFNFDYSTFEYSYHCVRGLEYSASD